MNDSRTFRTPGRAFLTMILIGAATLAACAAGASVGESKQDTDDSTVQAMTAIVATREATRPAETQTPLPSEVSAGRTREATQTPPLGPTATAAAGEDVEITGAIQSIDGSVVMIDGRTVVTNIRTELKFELAIGLVVTVQGMLQSDGSILAREIKN